VDVGKSLPVENDGKYWHGICIENYFPCGPMPILADRILLARRLETVFYLYKHYARDSDSGYAALVNYLPLMLGQIIRILS